VERGDLEVFHRTLDPDIEWRLERRGQLSRRDEVMAVIQSTLKRGVAVEVPPHVDAGDQLVLMPREMPPFFPPDAEGLFQGVEIGDGTIVAIRDFIHRDDAMAAATPVDSVSDPRWYRAASTRRDIRVRAALDSSSSSSRGWQGSSQDGRSVKVDLVRTPGLG
jgi:hypothetical protein